MKFFRHNLTLIAVFRSISVQAARVGGVGLLENYGDFQLRGAGLLKMAYDATFQRKWLYYLCYCEAGFQTRFTNDLHLVLARPTENID
jgi:hypothetical protein